MSDIETGFHSSFNKNNPALFPPTQKAPESTDLHQPQRSGNSPILGAAKIKKSVKSHTSRSNSRSTTPNVLSKLDRQRSDKLSNTKNTKKPDLNVSEVEQSDPDYFFENFDKIFKVRENVVEDSVPAAEPVKAKNIRRILLDDFTVAPSMPFSCKPDSFNPERFSARCITTKEKVLPKLEELAFKPYQNAKTEMQVQSTVSNMETEDFKDPTSEAFADIVKFELNAKLAKDRLPNLKLPKSLMNKPSSFNKLPQEGTTRIIDKINRFHENFLTKSRVKINLTTKAAVNLDSAIIKGKNSQQALQNLLKVKKPDPLTRSKTQLVDENNVESVPGPVEEARPRVNSVQGIDHSMRKQSMQKHDLSLDLGNGSSKVKFILKNLEQRTSSYYYQGILSKINGTKDPKSTNATSRSQYHKENLSILLNSSRDKILEVPKLGKGLRDSVNLPVKQLDPLGIQKIGTGQTCRVKVGDITQLYKGPRGSVNTKDQVKAAKNIRIGVNAFNPLKEISNISMDSRSTSVPRR